MGRVRLKLRQCVRLLECTLMSDTYALLWWCHVCACVCVWCCLITFSPHNNVDSGETAMNNYCYQTLGAGIRVKSIKNYYSRSLKSWLLIITLLKYDCMINRDNDIISIGHKNNIRIDCYDILHTQLHVRLIANMTNNSGPICSHSFSNHASE